MRLGQPVKLEADLYGSQIEYTGRLAGVGAGTGSAFALLSVPTFLSAILLIYLFAVELRWLPATGYVPFTEDPLGNLRFMVLPAMTLALAQAVTSCPGGAAVWLAWLGREHGFVMATARVRSEDQERQPDQAGGKAGLGQEAHGLGVAGRRGRAGARTAGRVTRRAAAQRGVRLKPTTPTAGSATGSRVVASTARDTRGSPPTASPPATTTQYRRPGSSRSITTCSQPSGLRLCGMVLLPTCPGRLPSRTSSISLRCKW